MKDEQATLEADLLVLGAGIAGLSAAAAAARRGKSVIVVEKGPAIGGSAVLSGGGLWTLAEADKAEALDPRGNPALARVMAGDFTKATAFVETIGAQIQPPARIDAIQGFPSVVRAFDVLSYLKLCAAEVRQAEGWVVTNAEATALLRDGDRIAGAEITEGGVVSTVRAPWTLLACGGFCADAALRREWIGDHAADLPVRANPYNTGGGIALALKAGAALRPQTDVFYGHLVATPRKRPLVPPDFLRLAQIATPHMLLLDSDGRRIVDESKTYYGNACAVAALPTRRGLLVADEFVRDYDLHAYPGGEQIDRLAEARREGAHVAQAASLEELGRIVADWGYRNVPAAVQAYNKALEHETPLDPPRRANRRAFTQAPYWAMEVEPAITMTFRGLTIDAHARVLDETGVPIPGLLAAGGDACFYDSVYFGGLSLGLIFGLRAAETALAGG